MNLKDRRRTRAHRELSTTEERRRRRGEGRRRWEGRRGEVMKV